MRDPVRRAEQCFACHVGNLDQGKVVTHAMFAAGHPPLPGIEIEHFVREMPPHWQYLNSKEQFEHRDAYVENHFPFLVGKSSDESYRTRAVVLGGVVALRENVELFLDLAARQQQPDLAAFDCFACHHELRTPSWRQGRGYLGRPGRPAMREWPTALVKLGIFHAATSNGKFDRQRYDDELAVFDEQMSQLHASLSARPYGEPERLIHEGHGLIDTLNQLILQLEQKQYDRREAIYLMKYLCRQAGADAHVRWHDYDSARQVGWALRSIYVGVAEKPANDAQIQKALDELTELLRLDLPSRHERQISEELDEALLQLATYNPEDFHQQIEAFGRTSTATALAGAARDFLCGRICSLQEIGYRLDFAGGPNCGKRVMGDGGFKNSGRVGTYRGSHGSSVTFQIWSSEPGFKNIFCCSASVKGRAPMRPNTAI